MSNAMVKNQHAMVSKIYDPAFIDIFQHNEESM